MTVVDSLTMWFIRCVQITQNDNNLPETEKLYHDIRRVVQCVLNKIHQKKTQFENDALDAIIQFSARLTSYLHLAGSRSLTLIMTGIF